MNFPPFGTDRQLLGCFRGANRVLLTLWFTVSFATAAVAAPSHSPRTLGRSTASRTVSTGVINVSDAPVIISPSTADGLVDQSFNYQIVLANFETGTFTADGLAPGLVLDARTGVISGVPTVIGTFAINLTATNPGGIGAATLTLTVEPANPPEITSTAAATGLRGNAFRYQIVATNSPTSYGADVLPEGLALNTSTGLISGVPTTSGAYSLVLSATNVRGQGNLTLQLNVIVEVPVVTLVADVPTANPLQGELGSFTLTRTGNDLSQPLTVVFSIKGTAQNGVDYQSLTLSKTIKAGKTIKRIHITAYNTDGSVPGSKKTVKLTLQSSDAYTIGNAAVAKVKIFYDP